jgi:virginiamycin B lyase
MRVGSGSTGSLLCMGIVSGVLALTCSPAPAIATAGPGPVVEPSYHPGGEPLILASDGHGGIWYGGAATHVSSEESEAESSIWHLTAGGGVTRLQLPTKPVSRFARYFATGQDGVEWFLAETDINASMELGRVSASGELTLSPIALEKGVRLRGLAVDTRGDLWSTQSGTKGRWRRAGIVRIAPDGQVTVFRRGLLKGAIPANIAAGAQGTLWFLDDAGRVGHVLADGQIREIPIGRPVVLEGPAFAPMRPLLVAGNRLWFIVGPKTIGEMTTVGEVRFITPHSSYSGIEALGGSDGGLVGLAMARNGDLWFTRDSGEVARIRADGRVQTLTNRLVDAYGIAFDGQGNAWVGEGPGYERENLAETPFDSDGEAQMALPRFEHARLAQVDPSGRSRQFPSAPSCRVPSLVGTERSLVGLESTKPFGVSEEASLSYCEHRVRLGHVTVRSRGRHGRLFVVAQRPAPGSRTHGYVTVAITLAEPSTPPSCGIPRPFSALYRSRRLLVWRVATVARQYEGVRESYYACLPGRHKTRRITSVDAEEPESGDGIARMAHAGHYIAYVTSHGSKYGGGTSLTVEDVATGSASTTETEAYASEYGGQAGPERLPPLERLGAPLGRGVYELALSPDGEVSWLGHSEASPGSPSQSILYLRTHDRDSIRRLAVASQINAVRFSGATVEWREDGQTRSMRG